MSSTLITCDWKPGFQEQSVEVKATIFHPQAVLEFESSLLGPIYIDVQMYVLANDWFVHAVTA